MHELPFRTGKTALTNDDLILLGVLFDGGARIRNLYRDDFGAQWNLGYSHTLPDHELPCRMQSLCEQGILKTDVLYGQTFFFMTPAGGELWSLERCPGWERYCSVRHTTTTSKARTLISAIAVSREILEDFLTLTPMFRARHRTAVIAGDRMLSWRTFPKLYFGITTYVDFFSEEYPDDGELERYWARLKNERSWWGSVPDLQFFTSRFQGSVK